MCDEEPKFSREEWERAVKLQKRKRTERALIVIGIASCYWCVASVVEKILTRYAASIQEEAEDDN